MSNEILDLLRTWTITNLFIIPLLGIPRAGLSAKGFVNAYMADNIREIEYERGVYVLFKPNDSEKFEEFLDSERARGARIIDEYDYPNGFVMVVYQYDKKWIDDVGILMDGKYSKVSSEFKNIFPKTKKTPGSSKESLTIPHSIFRKSQEYIDYWEETLGLEIDWREDEVWPFYKEREIFNQEILDKL